jgi:hypothetical protein
VSLAEILDAVRTLPRAEKVRLLHALIDDVGGGPEFTPEEALLARYFPPGATFEIATPLDSYEGAAVLQQLLDREKGHG